MQLALAFDVGATTKEEHDRLWRQAITEEIDHRRLLADVRATMHPGNPRGPWTIMDWQEELGWAWGKVRELLQEAGVPERRWG